MSFVFRGNLHCFFKWKSKKLKPSSLWSIYSMLRISIKLNHSIDITNYVKLKGILKAEGTGFFPNKINDIQRCRHWEIFKESSQQQIFRYEGKYENKIHHVKSHEYNLTLKINKWNKIKSLMQNAFLSDKNERIIKCLLIHKNINKVINQFYLIFILFVSYILSYNLKNLYVPPARKLVLRYSWE